jgi:hypothetical protein
MDVIKNSQYATIEEAQLVVGACVIFFSFVICVAVQGIWASLSTKRLEAIKYVDKERVEMHMRETTSRRHMP